MDDEHDFLCARCARRRKTCCQVSEIHVTLGDVARITEHSGRTEFWEFRPPEKLEYADQSHDPVWRDHVFRADGTRRVLKRQPNGDCTFLSSQGCTLPLSVRPLVCRLYPYEYDAGGLTGQLAEGCPVELLQPGQPLLVALEMHESAAQQWHQQLYAEIQQTTMACPGEPAHAYRPDL